MDISWDEVAKYATETPETVKRTADFLNKYPDLFLFGIDCVAPISQESLTSVYYAWGPVWKLLTPKAKEATSKGNYERIFDQARKDVRAWEAANVGKRQPPPKWSPASGYKLSHD